MNRGTAVKTDLAHRLELLRHTWGFEGLDEDQLEEIAGLAFFRSFAKGENIFCQNDQCNFFHVVAQGLVKVSICSSSGIRITYLLAGRGEPLNLVGPFTGAARFISAEALEEASVMHVRRDDFLSFVFRHPTVVINIIAILGHAIDSANGRIIDMMEKRVEERLLKVLYTLYRKFGVHLHFTSRELAELAGTTTESALRAMGRLRDSGVIGSGRGQVSILKPDRLEGLGDDTLWV